MNPPAGGGGGGGGGSEKPPLVPQPAATVKTNGEASSGVGGIKPAPAPPASGGGGGAGAGSGGGKGGGGGLKKGPWTAAEDAILVEYVKAHGEGNWNSVQRNTGLARCGKSCRLRWANHLRPNLKKGSFSPEEELLILRLHAQLGNKWARMAALLPGRTDNEIKNYWNTRMKRRQRAGLPVYSLDVPKPVGFGQLGSTSPRTPPSLQQPSSMGLQHPPPNTKYTTAKPPPLLDFFSFAPQTSPSLPYTPQALSPLGQRPVYNNQLGFQFPLSPSPVTPPPTPNSLFQQAAPPPLLPITMMQFNLGSYNISTPPPPLRRHPMSQPVVKVELPSTQLYPELVGFDDGGCSDGLLDALLQDAPGTGGDELKLADFLAEPAGDLSKESSRGFEASLRQSEFMDFDIGIKMVNETTMNAGAICDDISTPPAAMGLDWYISSSGEEYKEVPRGQEEALKDGSGGETSWEMMNQFATSYSITNVDQDWNINSFSNLPGLC